LNLTVTCRPYVDKVAILASPEGPAPPGRRPPAATTPYGCDPRQPRRAGATMATFVRSSAPSVSCDPRQPRRAGATCGGRLWGGVSGVAILASPEGPAPQHSDGANQKEGQVAILASPEGPAPPPRCPGTRHRPTWLRSSPAPKGRRHRSRLGPRTAARRCCDPRQPRRAGATLRSPR